MKTILLAFLSLLFIPNTGYGKTMFSKYFGNEALRYDYELFGDQNSVEVVPVQIKILNHWGGNPAACIDEQLLGNYNFELFDLNSGELIYRKGFCTLFGEWQTTAEARKGKKSFYQALHFPKPIANARLVINDRDSMNNWKMLYTDTLKVANYFMINEAYPKHKVDTIHFSGNLSDKIDIAILAEGYTVDEFEKFRSDARRLTDSLFEAEPFKKLKNRFNVWAVELPSLESGTDVPGKMIYKNTALNAHFYTFDSPRYLTTNDLKSVYDALDNVPFDHIYLLVNTEIYGGGGFYNFLNVCSADNERSPFVFCHEFGHGFAGLGDEYYTSDTSYEEFFKKTKEPWETNLTTLIDFNSKWAQKIEKGVPIPTPRDSLYLNKIGVFEGGGYEPKGIYSPSMTCWMKEMAAGEFCPVCAETIERIILNQTK